MKSMMKILRLSTLVLLFSCGGGEDPESGGGGGGGTQNANIAGNWQVNMASTISGISPMTLAGSITQSGSSVNGKVHVDGSNCFDRLTSIELTGTLTSRNLSLSSTSIDGQVLALTGRITSDPFTASLSGSYTISGGCAHGDQGIVAGFKVRSIGGTLRAEFESKSEEIWGGTAILTQSSPSPEGSFGIDGTVDVSLRCFSGTIISGTFPSPSFILGTSAALNINTDDGTLIFEGTISDDGAKILGFYNVVGGRCNGEGGRGCFGSTHQGSCFS